VYDPDAMTITDEYRNPDEDAIKPEWGDLGWESPEGFAVSLDSRSPTSGTSSDDEDC
jgi:hypothetical protein